MVLWPGGRPDRRAPPPPAAGSKPRGLQFARAYGQQGVV